MLRLAEAEGVKRQFIQGEPETLKYLENNLGLLIDFNIFESKQKN